VHSNRNARRREKRGKGDLQEKKSNVGLRDI